MDKTKVLSAAATLLIGEKGEEASAVGYTSGGVSITKSIDTRDIEADQTKHPLYIDLTSENYEISFSLLEITTENVYLGWAEGDSNYTDSTLSLGVSLDSPNEYEIQIYANNKAGEQIKFTFYDCILVSTESLEYRKDGEAMVGATFRALYDDDYDCCGLMEVS